MIEVKRLGDKIRTERKRQLLTIEKLSEKAEITENYLGKIERGEGMPSLQTVDDIARALNVSIDFLIGKIRYDSEYQFINGLIELNSLSEENKTRYIDFIISNIKYFK